MTDFKIEFNKMEWVTISLGAKQKQFQNNHNRIRLLRLEDSFEETDWCTNGHIGYVLDGEMTLYFAEHKVHYKTGNAFIINSDSPNKHKAKIEKNKFVEMILIEEIK